MKNRPVYDSKEKRLELLSQLNEIRDVNLASDRIDFRPSIELSSLSLDQSLTKFTSIWEDYYKEITKNPNRQNLS